MQTVFKVALSIVTTAGVGYGGYKLFNLCKKAYEDEVRQLKKEIQDNIDNITALNSRHNVALMATDNALLEEARAQLLRTDPDIDTLRSLLSILKGTINHLIQGRS